MAGTVTVLACSTKSASEDRLGVHELWIGRWCDDRTEPACGVRVPAARLTYHAETDLQGGVDGVLRLDDDPQDTSGRLG